MILIEYVVEFSISAGILKRTAKLDNFTVKTIQLGSFKTQIRNVL